MFALNSKLTNFSCHADRTHVSKCHTHTHTHAFKCQSSSAHGDGSHRISHSQRIRKRPRRGYRYFSWPPGKVAVWHCGTVAVWQCGSVSVWHVDGLRIGIINTGTGESRQMAQKWLCFHWQTTSRGGIARTTPKNRYIMQPVRVRVPHTRIKPQCCCWCLLVLPQPTMLQLLLPLHVRSR